MASSWQRPDAGDIVGPASSTGGGFRLRRFSAAATSLHDAAYPLALWGVELRDASRA